ncbi:Fe-Mn family superoxide dismutase [Anoxybacillus voinovskiensis]|uniref:superoxide dismutase n=1 Tax=Anoxybacteroides voinovskiense TaxID=230470 RepID=A0A840DN29_9BACL|nr:Fe-Mn family superoxide dismutase [Anoxybacillus voinovskiensis]GGJ59676.1 hypothetical protein GCM10008982_05940 [Anoxybacillus voinovskiensis]
MEQQVQWEQYIEAVKEWAIQVAERSGMRKEAEELLTRLSMHEGEWTEEAVKEVEAAVASLYERAVQTHDEAVAQEEREAEVEEMLVDQYIEAVIAWGKQVAEYDELREEAEELLMRLSMREGEWTEEAVKKVETTVASLYEQAVQRVSQEEPATDEEGEQLIERAEETSEEVAERAAGGHTLPPLPYRYDALEPHISREIMYLHHTKHHQSYVDGLNKAEKMMEKARETNDYELLTHWEREAAFHGSGHYLHTIFWYNMTPKGGGEPKGALLEQIKTDFGSVARFKNHFTEAAKKVEGVGWAILVWSPRAHRLEILQTEKHQLMTQWDTIPLLVLDVWEHAYYLQYKNDRAAYINSWWNVVNWRDVEQRFEQARRLQWQPF